MKKSIIAASALLAGTAALSQTAPVDQSSPAPAASTSAPAAKAHPRHDRTMTRTEVVQMVRDHFSKMDTDKDGAITTAETDAVHANKMKDFKAFDGGHVKMMGDPNAAFDRLDTDKNGSISREEFTKAREERVERRMVIREERMKDGEGAKDGKQARHAMRMHRMGGMGGHMIAMADTNKDGRITLAEAEAMALQHFDEMDTNKDGQVTREERREGRRIIIERKIEEKKSAS